MTFCHSGDSFGDAKRSLISDIKSYNFYGELLELSQIHCQSKLIAMHCNKKVKQRQTNKLENDWEGPWQLEDRHTFIHSKCDFLKRLFKNAIPA